MLNIIYDALKWFLSLLIPIFREQPKIRISYEQGSPRSYGEGSDIIKCEWNGLLKLYNETAYVALDINFLPNYPYPKIDGAQPSHLKALEPFDVKIKESKVIRKEEVLPCKYTEVFFPDILKEFNLILQYKNQHGKNFYTIYIYRKRGQEQQCSFHRRIPKESQCSPGGSEGIPG